MDQRATTPIAANGRKQTMLDLVEFGRGGRIMMASGVSSANFYSSRLKSRKRDPLLPPPSAVIKRSVAFG